MSVSASDEVRDFATDTPYAVKLPVFEGPLDLLLHLIRINEVEVTDIPIASIGEQYLEYLQVMRELNLDVAGEYLLMAATLAWIKSRMLLPPDHEDVDEEIDPRAELIARLLEYQRFKEAAQGLAERPLLGREVFRPRPAGPEPVPEGEREVEVGLFELVAAFQHALRAARPSGAPHEIEAETITVRERMLAVMDVLALRERVLFTELIATRDGDPISRPMLIATFLAILELTRLAALRLYQGIGDSGAPRGPIHLRRVEDSDGRSWSERIPELM